MKSCLCMSQAAFYDTRKIKIYTINHPKLQQPDQFKAELPQKQIAHQERYKRYPVVLIKQMLKTC